MNGFLVWYVLAVTAIEPNGQLSSSLFIEQDLPTCIQAAQRAMAVYPQGNAKWRCHEMTTEVKDRQLLVTFPEN